MRLGFLRGGGICRINKNFETQKESLQDLLGDYDTPYGKMTIAKSSTRTYSIMGYTESRHFEFPPSDGGGFVGISKYLKD